MMQWLLEQDFMPHGHCYFWRPDILWTHVLSDGVIAIAYFSIPVTLVYFLSKRKDVPFRGVIALFAAFIILCGTTHVMGIITVWQPIYAVDGLVKAATALVSILTAMVMVPLVPIALGMRSPAELEKSNKSLVAEVERRRGAEKRLQLAVDSLRRSNEDLEQFASVASHDLQSPLRAVVNFSQLLRSNTEGKLDKDSGEFLDYIEDGGKRMQSLIADLLKFSRVGKDAGEMTAVAMQEALDLALEHLQVDIKDSNASIHADNLPMVLGHKMQLTQLLQNLIGNSIKYVATGVRPEVHISACQEENEWHFIISDNGIGIEEKHLDNIFLIFRRLHTHDKYSGSGIGLSICKKIILEHKGRLWVKSQAGKGSQFHFTLPGMT